MVKLTAAFAALMLGTLAMSEAAVYIGGGCYDCNPPAGQGPGIYTGLGGGGGGGRGGGGRGGGGGAAYYNPGAGGGGNYYNPAPAGGRPVYSGNFGPGGGGGGGGGGGYDNGLTQIISG